MIRSIAVAVAVLACAAVPALAQDKGTLNPQPLPPLAHPADPATPAKELFGRKVTPASLAARSIGTTTAAASPAPWRCRSMARPGR